MSSQNINRYRCDLRDYKFLFFEQFRLQDILGKGPLEDWGVEEVNMVMSEVYKWACEVAGPLNQSGDAQGCVLTDGEIKTPDGFKEAWKSLYEAGWRGLGVEEKYGGQGGPKTLAIAANEIMSGANTSFNMYPGLTQGAAEVIEQFGTPEQVKTYGKKMFTGKWSGTMCLTEPQAGSDVGASTTKATRLDDGRYKIEGTKIFISCGQHDLTDNIIHMVLARTEGAPAGTKGLSLFIVPRENLDGSGSNNVVCASIEHKMGINASSTCVLNFGEGGDCIGELVGEKEQVGMKQMFLLMNVSRIGVGTQGLGVASAAYLNALEYAKERLQGASVENFKDANAPRVPIIEHADVRRMLLDMKARTEGIRALIIKLAVHGDNVELAEDEDKRAYHKGQLDLLVPLVKAYSSDQAFSISATAVQVYGGAGFLRDHPVEQHCRDAKIFSIYEGTNHIQALDLVGRQLGQKGGANFQNFLKDIGKFVAENGENEELGFAIKELGEAAQALGATAMRFLGWFQGGKPLLVPLNANRFLEMMSVTTVAWLLLEQGMIAEKKLAELAEDDAERNFYLGKRYSCLYYANLELGRVVSSAKHIGEENQSPLLIPDEAFSTLEF
jgi:alkylation response protein AidB-like acyl-CoA dehydrogenase